LLCKQDVVGSSPSVSIPLKTLESTAFRGLFVLLPNLWDVGCEVEIG
jgi:hypothetical protein